MNFIRENETTIFDYVLKELNITKKTKRFWDYLFDNILVPEYTLICYGHDSTYSIVDVYKKQIELAKKYDENVEDTFMTYRDMVYAIIKQELEDIKHGKNKSSIDELINLYSKENLRRVVNNHPYLISNEMGETLLNYFNINELYKMNVVNEELIKKHIDEFDKNLFYDLGFKTLSTDFIEKYTDDMELLDMSTIEVDSRPNVGLSFSPLYENAGCCLGEKHCNGVDVYVPYGIWCDIFNAIEVSSRCLSNNIESIRSSIENIEKSNEIDDVSKQLVISNLNEEMKTLKKHRMLLNNFSQISSEV